MGSPLITPCITLTPDPKGFAHLSKICFPVLAMPLSLPWTPASSNEWSWQRPIHPFLLFIIFCCAGSSSLLMGFLWLLCTGSRHTGFSSCGSWAQQLLVSAVAAHRLSVVARGFQTVGLAVVGTRVSLLHGLCNLPRPGIELMSPALAGRFVSTGPAGKSQFIL